MINFLCMSACFGAKVWKVADPWDTCLVPSDAADIMVGGGDCPHAGLPLYIEYERERSLYLLTMSFTQIAQLLRFALRR
jgi:hypothetical protein